MQKSRRWTALASLSLAAAVTPACVAAQNPPPAMPQTGAQTVAPEGVETSLGYADLADLVLAAPVIADVAIRSTARIKPEEAVGLAAGMARLYVEADVQALVRGAEGLPPRIGYLVDVATDSRGRPPKLKKARFLIFARLVPGNTGQVQLVARHAQLDWTPDTDARTRTIAKDVLDPAAPPQITGVGNAFHVAGALPGEGETQIFLTTANQRPVSLSILRRPGEQPRWAVALSEIVDEAAAAPPRDSLLWYRLACGLPDRLPETSTASLTPEDAAVAVADFRFVRDSLGSCGRRFGG